VWVVQRQGKVLLRVVVAVMPTQSVTGMAQTIEAEVRQLTGPQKCRVIEGCGRLLPTRFHKGLHAFTQCAILRFASGICGRPVVRGYWQPRGVCRSTQHEGPCSQPLVQLRRAYRAVNCALRSSRLFWAAMRLWWARASLRAFLKCYVRP